MITADLRTSLVRHSVCPSARRAIMSGRYFLFEGVAMGVVSRVAEFLEETNIRDGDQFREFVQFAKLPFETLAIEFKDMPNLIHEREGFVGLIACISSGEASFYGVMPAGGIVTLGEAVDIRLTRLVGAGVSSWAMINIIACLLILNRPACFSLSDRPTFRRVVGGKLRPFAAHHVVTVSVSPFHLIRLIRGGSSGVRLRRHERRGHFSHRGGNDPACVHLWVREECDRNEHWRCSDCGRLRYWIRPHDVGDASIGFVTKQYAVRGSCPDGRRATSAGGLGI